MRKAPETLAFIGCDADAFKEFGGAVVEKVHRALDRGLLPRKRVFTSKWDWTTLLHKAVDVGDAILVKRLVQNGGNVKACDQNGNTPLENLLCSTHPIELKHLDCVRELLKGGADCGYEMMELYSYVHGNHYSTYLSGTVDCTAEAPCESHKHYSYFTCKCPALFELLRAEQDARESLRVESTPSNPASGDDIFAQLLGE
jgi:hypothetical protein